MEDDERKVLDALDPDAAPAERKRGRPSYERDEQLAADIKRGARWGLTNEQLAGMYEIPESTMKKHYGVELKIGRVGGVQLAAGKLFEKILAGNLTAIIFYLKTKGGFIEARGITPIGKDGQPIDLSDWDLTGETDADLAAAAKEFERRLDHFRGRSGGSAKPN